MKSELVLGVSAHFHDSAAALVADGVVVAAAQEERFSRIRHDPAFPIRSIRYCLAEAGVSIDDLTSIAYYENPRRKLGRILASYASIAPAGLSSFRTAMPAWLSWKSRIIPTVRRELVREWPGRVIPPITCRMHHESHAASAFLPSPYGSAAVLCVDGVGEWTTTSIWRGTGNRIEPVAELRFPHSLGMLYSAFTYFCGFKVDSGEYKLMGLAPYGEPRYADVIRETLIDLKPDGSFRLNMDYFEFLRGRVMTGAGFEKLFGGPRRPPEGPLTSREFDLAASVQVVTEDAIIRLSRTARNLTGETRLCLAGGVALNCVANGRILTEELFEEVWVQPAAGDAGGALGAALLNTSPEVLTRDHVSQARDAMGGSLLGPSYHGGEITSSLDSLGAAYQRLRRTELIARVAGQLAEGKVVGWFQGRMEFGPRALGARSILGDPRNRDMQSTMNLKIKFRESFRPFAPAVLASDAEQYFELKQPSPYMLFVAKVAPQQRLEADEGTGAQGLDRLKVQRSTIPAVTHVDLSARVQTVWEEDNAPFHELLTEFKRRTGCPVLVNTSFNVRGEPIVESPADAYVCFMRTNIDVLVIGDVILEKSAQPPWAEDGDWRQDIALD
jgi:carbamoyltransferase